MKSDLLLQRTNKALGLDKCATSALLVGPGSPSRIDCTAGIYKQYSWLCDVFCFFVAILL